MTQEKTSENGRGRPPDLSKFGDGGPTKARGRIELALSTGTTKELALLSRDVLGSDAREPRHYMSKVLRAMVGEGLVSVVQDPNDGRKKNYRWKSFEDSNPTPITVLPSWLDIPWKPDSIANEDMIPGSACHTSVAWITYQNNRVIQKSCANTITDKSTEELEAYCVDVVDHWKKVRPPPMFQTGIGEVTAAEMLLLVRTKGGLPAGAISTLSTFMNRSAVIAPRKLFLPALVLAGRGGYTWRPGVARFLRAGFPAVVGSLFRPGIYLPDPAALNQLMSEVNQTYAKASWSQKGTVVTETWERFKEI